MTMIDPIIADHRRFQDLLRELRSAEDDCERVRTAYSALRLVHLGELLDGSAGA